MKILKRDALGRVTAAREQRETLPDAASAAQGEFERGGPKRRPFARLVVSRQS